VNNALVHARLFERAARTRITVTVICYLALSQVPQPWIPAAALDVLLFVLAGWRFWPLVPLAALVQSSYTVGIGHALEPVIERSMAALIYASAVWILKEKLRVRVPPRGINDVLWFCALLVMAAPAFAGVVSMAFRWAFHAQTNGLAADFARYVSVNGAAILVLVPTALAAFRWKVLRPPAAHREPPLAELIVLLALTGALVLAQQPLLDLSFVTIAWIAVRYGLRGAVIGSAVVAIAASVHTGAQTFVGASALMALLVGSLTTERWDLLTRLSQRAYVDDLTGLPNRERLIEWVDRHRDVAVVLVVLDVDEMRLLNEGVGRIAADRTLQDIALRLRAGLPTSYFIARLSADEFAVALVDDRSPHAIMGELRGFFDAPFDMDGLRVFVSVSLGAVRMAHGGSGVEMLRKADIALHRAKSSPTRSVVYSSELQPGPGPSLVGELHRAVELGELVPFFQPIYRYDIASSSWQIAGAEALLRWMHPERGIVGPVDFIDLLERLAIGERVGWNVVEHSLLQAGKWRRDVPDFRVWVNLFARQALDRKCPQRIAELLEITAVPADALVVEISERIVASDERDMAALAQALKEMGVHTAIDDFGTGGSSLGRVRDVPAEILKIDRLFVARSEVDAKAKAVASTVVRLASELGMTVLAEGVENSMQLRVMRETGCDYAQGYELGHPLPADLFERTFLRVSA